MPGSGAAQQEIWPEPGEQGGRGEGLPPRGAPIQHVSSLFGPYILFGTKDRALAGVRPCTGQRSGQMLPVNWRGTRTRMNRGEGH